MIKSIALIVTIFNPANDMKSEHVYSMTTLGECFIAEKNMYKHNSPMMIEIKKNHLELVESKCERVR